LGRFPKDEAAGKALQAMAAKDASEYVAGSALLALARSKQPKAFDVLSKALDRTSHNDVVAIQALNGLAMLRDAAAIAVASARTGPGNPLYVRVAAARCLANLWEFVERKPQEEIRDVLITMMRDSNRQVRRGVYAACAVIADGALASIVESTGGDEPVGLLAKLSRDTARKMREKAANQSKLADLRKRVEEMDEKNKKLEARLAQIEASLGAKAPSKRRRPSS
jgi:aminopeptidase N